MKYNYRSAAVTWFVTGYNTVFGLPLMQLDTSSSSVSLGWQDGECKAGFQLLPSVNGHIVLPQDKP